MAKRKRMYMFDFRLYEVDVETTDEPGRKGEITRHTVEDGMDFVHGELLEANHLADPQMRALTVEAAMRSMRRAVERELQKRRIESVD